ncbi:MAG: asparagine synthase-related protein [Ferrovibrio sp.]
MSSLPYFLIEPAVAAGGYAFEHARVQPVIFKNDDGSIAIVLGHPILGERIAREEVAAQLRDRMNDDVWLASLNGEFLLFLISDNRLRIANSRFSYPPLWYSARPGDFVASTLFATIFDKMISRGRNSINQQAAFEMLVYKRVYGTKTLHDDIRLLEPAHRLDVENGTLKSKAYWSPDFSTKIDISTEDAADELSGRLTASIRRKSSDARRYALFLSGGMDTRLILAHASKANLHLPCITINAFENREVRVAKQAAAIAGQEHHFLPTLPGHYAVTLDEAVELSGGMSMPMCMFHGHAEAVRPIADVAFHGHGFDYFFQGMYIPAKRYAIAGRVIPYRRMRAINGDIVDDFIKSISYRLKGASLEQTGVPEAFNARINILRDELRDIAGGLSNRASGPIDIYEWLTFHNLARHYSTGDHWGINLLAEQRTISFDNDLYSLYSQLPHHVRFDARAMRLSLRRQSPDLANLISANHGYPIGMSSAGRTVLMTADFLRRRLLPWKRPEAADAFDRMGLPQEYLMVTEWRDALLDLSRSPRLEMFDFLDIAKTRPFLQSVADGRKVGDVQFLTLVMSLDRFLARRV